MPNSNERDGMGVVPADDGLVSLDADGVIVTWDDTAQAMFGWSSHEALGASLTDLIAAPAEVAEALADLARSQTAHTTPAAYRRVRLAARHRNGHVLPVELTAWVAGGYEAAVNALVRDLTASLRAEGATAQLEAILTSSPEAVISEEVDGTITSWNVAAERIFGWTSAEAVGKNASMLVPTDYTEEAATLSQRVRRGERVANQETRRLHKQGHALDVALTLSPIRDQAGRVTAVATIARDIAEERWRAVALDDSNRQQQAAVDTVESSDERVRSFLADAARQLCEPITGVLASAESLLADPSQPARHRLLADMVREAARAGRLVNSLLRMAQLGQGQHMITPEPCDLLGLCIDEADRLYSLAPNLDVVLRAERLDDLRPAVDAEAVREVLSNLLDNARRYAVARISVTVTVQNGTVEIRVADDGFGLPEDLVERAFDPFVTGGDHSGCGLGLTIARTLARAHGGHLSYDGAFVLHLPVAAGPTAAGPDR